jgi:hypothetical protein
MVADKTNNRTRLFYSAWFVCCFIVILSLSFGCASLKKNSSCGVMFYEQEIRSKTWTDRLGQQMVLLHWQVYHLKRGEDLIVAKYGLIKGEEVFCIELYRPVRSYQNVNLFILLAHDYEGAKVADFNVQDSTDCTLIEVTREAPNGYKIQVGTNQFSHEDYALCYSNDGIVSRDGEEFLSQ